MIDMLEKGRSSDRKGIANNHSKLNDNEILEIRRLRSTGKYTLKALSEVFDVSQKTISLVARRESWKHI